MKNILYPRAIWAIAFLTALFFGQISLAQEIAVPPADGPTPLFRSGGSTDSIEKITIALPGTENPQPLTVSVRNGFAWLEGDINLGPIEELRDQAQDRGIRIDGSAYRWPNAVIPYIIDSDFSTQYRTLIEQAIHYVNGTTHLLLKPRTDEPHWVFFVVSEECASKVGRMYGQNNVGQRIWLMDPNENNGTGCYFKQIVHEIAHAAGLYHEQSREDRDNFVTIHWENIDWSDEGNFEKHDGDATDVGAYDFASAMHYSATAFSNNGQPTITANGGQSFGYASEYSPGDVAAINSMYATKNCPTNHTLTAATPSVSRNLHFEASNQVLSSAVINSGSTVVFDAGGSIRLNPGFRAALGSTFRAAIDGCGGNIQSIAGPEVEEWMAEIQGHAEQQEESEQPAAGRALAVLTLEAYPNPAWQTLHLQFTAPGSLYAAVLLFDLQGKSVCTLAKQQYFEAGEHRVICSLDGLPPGVYFAQLSGDRYTALCKVIKVHE